MYETYALAFGIIFQSFGQSNQKNFQYLNVGSVSTLLGITLSRFVIKLLCTYRLIYELLNDS